MLLPEDEPEDEPVLPEPLVPCCCCQRCGSRMHSSRSLLVRPAQGLPVVLEPAPELLLDGLVLPSM